jgi:hypothetical protein
VYVCTSEDCAHIDTHLVRAENQDGGLFDGHDEHEINLQSDPLRSISSSLFSSRLIVSPERTATNQKCMHLHPHRN